MDIKLKDVTDIAAGDIIASEANKKLYKYKDDKIVSPFLYNKENLVNNWFVVKDNNLAL